MAGCGSAHVRFRTCGRSASSSWTSNRSVISPRRARRAVCSCSSGLTCGLAAWASSRCTFPARRPMFSLSAASWCAPIPARWRIVRPRHGSGRVPLRPHGDSSTSEATLARSPQRRRPRHRLVGSCDHRLRRRRSHRRRSRRHRSRHRHCPVEAARHLRRHCRHRRHRCRPAVGRDRRRHHRHHRRCCTWRLHRGLARRPCLPQPRAPRLPQLSCPLRRECDGSCVRSRTWCWQSDERRCSLCSPSSRRRHSPHRARGRVFGSACWFRRPRRPRRPHRPRRPRRRPRSRWR